MKNNFRVVIHSRKRAFNMRHMLNLFPDATIYIHEEELKDYEACVPSKQIETHTEHGLTNVRYEALEHFKEEAIIFCDDDLQNICSHVGERQRHIIEPKLIKQIFNNSINICNDLDIKLFGYNRNGHPKWFKPFDPFSVTSPCAGCFGVIGRDYNFDKDMFTRQDIDLTMQVLLKDRIVFVDNRFYFNFGTVWKGEGGCQGLRTQEQEEQTKKLMYKKWGKLINLDTKKKQSTGFSINVKRKTRA